MMAKKFPTDSDYANSNKNLKAEDYEVDYAITHTCPLYRVKTLGYYHVAREEEPLQNYFQWVCDKLNQTNEMLADGSGDKKGRSFKHWYLKDLPFLIFQTLVFRSLAHRLEQKLA